MNLDSDIVHLSFTMRVHNALTAYGITQIGHLINADGTFVDGPRKLWIIPNIGKKSVAEIDHACRRFVDEHLTPHKTLNSGKFSDFVHELQDLVHKYVGKGGDIMWSSEDGWSELIVSIPREEEDEA